MDLLALSVALVLAASAPAAPPLSAGTVLRSADLQADLAVLRRAYTTLHPGLYRYNTPAEIEAAFGVLEREFRADRTLAEAYLALSVFAAKIRCGHTWASFYNQEPAVEQALFQAGRLPFHFRWLEGRMVVTRSFADDLRLAPGTEVLDIDGVPAATILERLLTVARADGGNDAKRVSSLEVQGVEGVAAFDVFLPLFYPPRGTSRALRVRDLRGQEATLELPLMTEEQRQARAPVAGAMPRGAEAPAWELRWLDEQTAYLRLPTWALYNTTWDWKGFLGQAFAALVARQAADLVIDLRGNEGGLDVGDEILAHLTTKPLAARPVVRRVRYRSVPEDLRPHLDTWDRSFFDWGSTAIEEGHGFHRLNREGDETGALLQPVAPFFGGRTWVLVGAANSSATFEFAQALRQHRLGTLVGQPTGGNQRGINGGAFFFLRLPSSRLELDLPLIGIFAEGEAPDSGLRPDLAVRPTREDVAQGRDAELEATRAEIARRRR